MAWLGVKGWRIVQATQSLLASQVDIENLMADGLMAADINAMEEQLLRVRQDVVTIKQETAVFMPLTPHLDWLPKVGPLMPVAAPLLDMADAGTEAAVFAFHGLKPALINLQTGTAGTEQIAEFVQVLDTARTDLEQASLAIDRLASARAELGDTTMLPTQIQALLERADPWLPIAQEGLKVAQALPQIMGQNGQQRYLIIAQNEDEIRPTGGFIAGAGLLVIENGRIVDLSFRDANQIDAWSDDFRYLVKPYGDPPAPIQQFMSLELFLFRDANFWPDFPTSAEMAMQLYTYGQETPPLDGAIAIDQQFMKMLLDVIGPINVPTETVDITSSNVISAMREAWGIDEGETVKEWIFDRKSFISTFATAMMTKVQTEFDSIDPLYLVKTIHDAIALRHLQIYMRNSEVATVLNDLNWDGRLANETGQDMFMLVDTNVGINKVNVYVDNTIRYQVDLGTQQADLTVSYQHHGIDRGETCHQGTPYTAEVTYIGRADTCYWDYVRVYAPTGSTLLDASRHFVPGASLFNGQAWDQPAQTLTDDPSGLSTFANLFLLPWGQQLDTYFHYQLPGNIIQSTADEQTYRLTVYKQPGIRPQPLEIVVKLPPGAVLIDATPIPTSITGTTINFNLNLETNREFLITYH